MIEIFGKNTLAKHFGRKIRTSARAKNRKFSTFTTTINSGKFAHLFFTPAQFFQKIRGQTSFFMDTGNKIILFQEKQIRRVWHNDEWWFAVVDVVAVLSGSENPAVYWRVLKKRLLDEGANQTVTNCNGFKMEAADGKLRITDCLPTKDLLRLVQSIPSQKAEPFKQWLAQVGYERIQEVENPELAADRARELYRAKGYPDEWIDMRLKSIEVRQQLTSEWKNRDVQEGKEYSILTAEIARATFGLTPTEHKDLKGLQRENLRDHMTNLELIFTMLGEESTRQVAITHDAVGFDENKTAAREGGEIAGKSRKEFEKRLGRRVVTADNFKKKIDGAGENEAAELPPAVG